MKKLKNYIPSWIKGIFSKPKEKSKFRQLLQHKKTGELKWGDGEKPFVDGPDEDGSPSVPWNKIATYELSPDEESKRSVLGAPFVGNRFVVDIPGIPNYLIASYNYLGTDVHSKKKLLSSNKVISDDYSVFRVVLVHPYDGYDICEALKDLENNPNIGDVTVKLLGAAGHVKKTIVIPGCKITEIKAFRELDYGNDGILYGEIVVKHKQRKFL